MKITLDDGGGNEKEIEGYSIGVVFESGQSLEIRLREYDNKIKITGTYDTIVITPDSSNSILIGVAKE